MEALLEQVASTAFSNPDKVAKLADAILTSCVPLQDLFGALERDTIRRGMVVDALVNRALFCAQLTGPNGFGDNKFPTLEQLMETVHPSADQVKAIIPAAIVLLDFWAKNGCARKAKLEALDGSIQKMLHGGHRGEDELLYKKLLDFSQILQKNHPAIFG